jgi:hypothetical protein
MNILPSKKIVSVFILTAALVVSIIIAFGRDKGSQVINVASNLVTGDKISIPENPNWQNELGGVSANTANTKTETDTPTKATVTDVVSQTLIENYLALKQNDKLNSASAQKLVDQTVNYVNQINSQVTKISESQLNIIPDNGKQSITDYGENLGNILKNNKPKEIKNEVEIINAAIKSKEQSKLNELDSIITVYEKTANELTKMPVPKTFVKAHLDIINGVKNMATALKEAKTILADPLKGLASIQLYKAGVTTFTQALKAASIFIYQNKIIYKQNSGGYYLFYRI